MKKGDFIKQSLAIVRYALLSAAQLFGAQEADSSKLLEAIELQDLSLTRQLLTQGVDVNQVTLFTRFCAENLHFFIKIAK